MASSTAPAARPAPALKAEPSRPSGSQKKLSYHEVRELAALPARIEALEAEQAQLQAEAASPDFYKHSADHIRNVLARIDAIAPELEQAVARWVHLEERS
jgi:ABC transport system ATP-binding/permease protein